MADLDKIETTMTLRYRTLLFLSACLVVVLANRGLIGELLAFSQQHD